MLFNWSRIKKESDLRNFLSLSFSFNFKGHVIDTPEVARAKAAHFAAYNHIAHSTPFAASEHYSQAHKPPTYSYDHHGSMVPSSHDGRATSYADELGGRNDYNDY